MEIDIYCDESRQELFRSNNPGKGRWVVMGGLWVESRNRSRLKQGIQTLRGKHRVWSEFKWNKVSDSRLDFYLDLVDFFFAEEARFRCLVLAAEELDVVRFHEGDRELMF